MEADWEIEVGGDAPVIDALWPGFVDLRLDSKGVNELEEIRQLPRLAEVLVRLNAASSQVWTSKCDVFNPERFDSDELDAPAESAIHAMACYIDILPRSDQRWPSPNLAIYTCKRICAHLLSVPLRGCRADLVVRRALIIPVQMDLGITAYFTACGPTAADATSGLERALDEFADAIGLAFSTATAASKLQ